ncbi:replication initiator [Streptosporangium sp. NPDC002607]
MPCDKVNAPWTLVVLREHPRRLIAECLRLGALDELADLRLIQWAHMLGFRGHFSTRSRHYSTTLGDIRADRTTYARDEAITTGRLPLFDEETVLVIAEWEYAGKGYPLGDALLADAPAEHIDRHKPEDVLFRTTRGNLIRRDYFNADVLKPAILTAGVPADMTFHDLRHTFASTALAEGVPISEVSRWLGHESITTTVDLYGHLVPEASERARTALDHAFATASGLT